MTARLHAVDRSSSAKDFRKGKQQDREEGEGEGGARREDEGSDYFRKP